MYKKNFKLNGAGVDFVKEFSRYFMIKNFPNGQNFWYDIKGPYFQLNVW